MLHGALSVSVGQDPSPIDEEKHRIEVAAAGSTLHDTRAAGDEAALQTPMVPRRRLVRAVEDMGPPGVARPSLVETVTAPPGTNIPENYTSANFAFDPYKDGPANVIGQPGPPGHLGITGHQGTIGNTGKTGHQGSPGSEGHDGPMGKPGHMFHLHGYATRSEVLKVFMLNFTMTTVAFLFLLKKLKEKYGPKGHGVEFSLTIAGIDFGKLGGKQDLWHTIEGALQESVSSQVGVSSSETHVTLSNGGSALMAETSVTSSVRGSGGEVQCKVSHRRCGAICLLYSLSSPRGHMRACMWREASQHSGRTAPDQSDGGGACRARCR